MKAQHPEYYRIAVAIDGKWLPMTMHREDGDSQRVSVFIDGEAWLCDFDIASDGRFVLASHNEDILRLKRSDSNYESMARVLEARYQFAHHDRSALPGYSYEAMLCPKSFPYSVLVLVDEKGCPVAVDVPHRVPGKTEIAFLGARRVEAYASSVTLDRLRDLMASDQEAFWHSLDIFAAEREPPKIVS